MSKNKTILTKSFDEDDSNELKNLSILVIHYNLKKLFYKKSISQH